MFASKVVLLLAIFDTICLLKNAMISGHTITDTEWNSYKTLYGKDFTNSSISEGYARYYYNYNRKLIDNHNEYYKRGLRSFGLRVNQFTDMRLVSFNALFPVASAFAAPAFNATLPKVENVIDNSFNITKLGFESIIEDQGVVCNSGWAYATSKSIELMHAFRLGNSKPDSLSAQNLIDCGGRSTGCKNQVPKTGFDYLTQRRQELHLSSEYKNDNKQNQPGMCVPPQTPSASVALQRYGIINDGDDESLQQYVNNQYPVVIEFNPTSFEFMHYGEGIFQQPSTGKGSHFMTVIGFGVNETANLKYFIVQNSFNISWGERGLARIAYSRNMPFARSAIFPII